MGEVHATGGSTVWLLRQALMMLMTLCCVWANPKPKEIEIVITGTKAEKEGQLVAPPGFPEAPYTLDATSYIFVLENVRLEGSVQVYTQTFDIHPKSWLTVRNSKYGGYIGQVLGRYDTSRAPPHIITTTTCCLRLEFETGCCGPAQQNYTGIRATYKFLLTPGKGRRSDCSHDKVFSQLCNGECIPPAWECPCPLYGQYKCDNGVCVNREAVCDGQDHCGDHSDEDHCDADTSHDRPVGLGVMYSFSVIIATVCSLLGFVCIMIFILSTAEKLINHKKGRADSSLARSQWCPQARMLSYAKLWPQPEVGTVCYHGNEVTRLPETIALTEVRTTSGKDFSGNTSGGDLENENEQTDVKDS